jgi:outer membrane protein assembly factor BamD
LLAGLTCANADHKVHVTKVKPKKGDKTDSSQSVEPDKVLYDRGMADIKRSKYTEARLDLQTLINTYPDSEYLAKSKLAIADSFYKEGGTSNLTQAVDEYKNFIVFFPFLDEAQYAQMQVAMCHYRMMEKADRDDSQAQAAEDEFRAFLLKYPQSPLFVQASQNLRNVQEVLADGEYRIAYFYYKTKQDYRASAARLVVLTSRYPLYSHSDTALYMLGNIYMRAKQASKNEDDKNHWGDLAAQCYSRIVKDYPLSRLASEAKARLTSMGMPVPKSDPEALARMQKQQLYEKEHHPNPLIADPVGMFRSNPDVHLAAHTGQPNLNPPDDTVSATEVLNQGAAGPKFNIAATFAPTGGASQGSDTESVESSDNSTATPAATTESNSPSTTPAAQIIDTPTAAPATAGATATEPAPTAAAAPSTMTALPSAPANGEAGSTAQAVATENHVASGNPDSNSLAPTATANPPAQASQALSTPAGSSSNSTQPNQTANSKDDSKNESSSKKKKGLHKIIP